MSLKRPAQSLASSTLLPLKPQLQLPFSSQTKWLWQWSLTNATKLRRPMTKWSIICTWKRCLKTTLKSIAVIAAKASYQVGVWVTGTIGETIPKIRSMLKRDINDTPWMKWLQSTRNKWLLQIKIRAARQVWSKFEACLDMKARKLLCAEVAQKGNKLGSRVRAACARAWSLQISYTTFSSL